MLFVKNAKNVSFLVKMNNNYKNISCNGDNFSCDSEHFSLSSFTDEFKNSLKTDKDLDIKGQLFWPGY